MCVSVCVRVWVCVCVCVRVCVCVCVCVCSVCVCVCAFFQFEPKNIKKKGLGVGRLNSGYSHVYDWSSPEPSQTKHLHFTTGTSRPTLPKQCHSPTNCTDKDFSRAHLALIITLPLLGVLTTIFNVLFFFYRLRDRSGCKRNSAGNHPTQVEISTKGAFSTVCTENPAYGVVCGFETAPSPRQQTHHVHDEQTGSTKEATYEEIWQKINWALISSQQLYTFVQQFPELTWMSFSFHSCEKGMVQNQAL